MTPTNTFNRQGSRMYLAQNSDRVHDELRHCVIVVIHTLSAVSLGLPESADHLTAFSFFLLAFFLGSFPPSLLH